MKATENFIVKGHKTHCQANVSQKSLGTAVPTPDQTHCNGEVSPGSEDSQAVPAPGDFTTPHSQAQRKHENYRI